MFGMLNRTGRVLAIICLASCWSSQAYAASETEEMIEKARLTAEKLLGHPEHPTLRDWVKRAKAVLVFPSLLKASFLFGAEGGSGVLMARDDRGRWSYPSFYSIGGGSFGLQVGVQDSEAIFVIMTEKGLQAIMDNSVKFGADASIAVGPSGAGVEGAVGLGEDADIYSFSMTRGIFAGTSLEGSVAFERSEWNEAYYGQPATSYDIVVKQAVSNSNADKLRDAFVIR